MINYRSDRQLSFSDFALPFSGSLDGDNRWVRLANLLPWDDLVRIYARGLSDSRGRATKDLRIELGTLIIQELQNYTDREVIAQIQENPYLQYFLGYAEYRYRQVFDPSLLVTIRKRLDREAIAEMTTLVAACRRSMEDQKVSKVSTDPEDPSHGNGKREGTEMPNADDKDEENPSTAHQVSHRGVLILDATAAELEIPYPTDLGLLNEARLQSERLIDVLWSLRRSGGVKKPRTYRQQARAAYLSLAKKRRRSRRQIRNGIKKQLQYLRRNIKSINTLLSEINPVVLPLLLKRRDRQLLATIRRVYAQQYQMYRERSCRIDRRIVNLYQPWIRPIKRGKAGGDVEFGPKYSLSLVEGAAYVDYFSWEAFHEGHALQDQVAAYRQRHGCYPEVVIADQIYGTRQNRRYLKSQGIRFSGKKLGRPVQVTAENREQLAAENRQRKLEKRRRNRIEGSFGVGRRRYGLGRVRTRLQATSETTICMTYFAMSIAAYLAACFVHVMKLWWRVQVVYRDIIGQSGRQNLLQWTGRVALRMA